MHPFVYRSKRNTFELTGEGNPPPWHYSIKDDLIKSKVPSHSGIFKSKLERGSYIHYNKVSLCISYSTSLASQTSWCRWTLLEMVSV